MAVGMLNGKGGFVPELSVHSRWRKKMKSLLNRLWKEEEGQDLTEYALLVVLIALVAIAAVTKLGTQIASVFSNAAANMVTSGS
jgi:pilus assembly protein Flp/PilA